MKLGLKDFCALLALDSCFISLACIENILLLLSMKLMFLVHVLYALYVVDSSVYVYRYCYHWLVDWKLVDVLFLLFAIFTQIFLALIGFV